MGHQQPHEEGSSDLGVRYGRCFATTAKGLHSSYGSWVAILFQRVSTASEKHDFKVSMSSKGNCYDNSMVETFFKSIKIELIWRNRWDTRRQAEGAIYLSISMGSTIRDAITHRWLEKTPWLLSARLHKRV